ncbi:hypothetical protein SDC9_179998 [bioreactor metagenome]|uniref:Uncharacterized protein n=1 Tax=bioreactor metagenome TaxID=1076179 RepID=A0A645H3E6_9ZZZZ
MIRNRGAGHSKLFSQDLRGGITLGNEFQDFIAGFIRQVLEDRDSFLFAALSELGQTEVIIQDIDSEEDIRIICMGDQIETVVAQSQQIEIDGFTFSKGFDAFSKNILFHHRLQQGVIAAVQSPLQLFGITRNGIFHILVKLVKNGLYPFHEGDKFIADVLGILQNFQELPFITGFQGAG